MWSETCAASSQTATDRAGATGGSCLIGPGVSGAAQTGADTRRQDLVTGESD